VTSSTDAILHEMLRWTRAAAYPAVHKLLQHEFIKGGEVDAVRAKIYQLSDGSSTSVAIAKAANVSQPFVSRLWKRWRQIGLAEPAGDGGRQTRRAFSLDDFGLAPTNQEDVENG
jgi:hypothetical protein